MDLAVAPLRDIPFNHAKSACKWLEFSLLGIPAVYSMLDHYQCIEHGRTGFLARDAAEFTHYVR